MPDQKITKERFAEILKEYGYRKAGVELLWEMSHEDGAELNEKETRELAQSMNGDCKTKMTKKKFAEVMRGYGYSDESIEKMWETRPTDYLDEEAMKITAILYAELLLAGKV